MAMTTSTTVRCCGYLPSKFPPPHKPTATAPPPPIFISTKPIHVDPHHVRELYSLCHHSCHRFPAAGKVEPVDLLKLRTAIAHSSVVVSVFTDPRNVQNQSPAPNSTGFGGEWIRKVAPENGLLVGFGRAVSDLSLTASIYDVMVHPALQGRGISRRIVQRIIRKLTNKGIYDIAALCTETERSFFSACGFGDDTLGSTTMMYTRAPSGNSEDEEMISNGRMLLVVPRPRKFMKQ